MGQRIDIYFVCNAKYHDTDFARVEILKLLNAETHEIRVKVGSDYSDLEAIANSDGLITYTCDLVPTLDQQENLQRFLEQGKKWFALHGTNSIIELLDNGQFDSPRRAPKLMEMLGSQFIAHPPVGEFHVSNVNPEHPLVQGIDDFDVTDELYLMEYHGERTCLLETRFVGQAQEGFVESNWPEDIPHEVMYLRPYGKGEVLYLTLGHCRSTYDMQPLMDEYPNIERCAWEKAEYYELLKRGIRWLAGLDITQS